MKSWFLTLIFFTCFSSYGTMTNYYHYDTKGPSVSPERFRRYVRPQIRSMSVEFFHVLEKLQPLNGDVVKAKNKIMGLNHEWKKWTKQCSIEVTDECFTGLENIYKEARILDKFVLGIQNRNSKFSDTNEFSRLESFLLLSYHLDDLSNTIYQILHYIEEYLITSNTSYFPYFQTRKNLGPLFHKLQLLSQMMVTALLNNELRSDFDAVWMNFFRLVEEKIIYERDKDYLIAHLEELNASWNTFHMKATKSDMELPKNIITVIKIMHNRWNSVLKIVIKY